MSSERKPHVARLVFALTAGPAFALLMQALAYADVPWACNGGSVVALHVMAAVFVVFTVVALFDAFSLWRLSGRGVETRQDTPADHSRFVALSGMALSLASLLLIVAMWVPVFVFDPCVR